MTTPRPEHAPVGNPCTRCGLDPDRHRTRSRDRTAYQRAFQAAYRAKHGIRPKGPRRIIALDGEGYSLRSGGHRYVYLAACDGDGLVSSLENSRGITFNDFATWLLDSLPRGALLVGFSLGYDRTKLLESLPDPAIWGLLHPGARQGKHGPRAVRTGGWRVNLVSSLFTVKRESDGAKQRVWDLFKFFQSSFVVALEKWSIGTPEERARIAKMKAKRGSFRGIGEREQAYCQSECVLLAKLAKALLDAHDEEDLHLTSFYGPGSTAALILKSCDAESQNARLPPEAEHAVDSAYFGGRFELSRIGHVKGPIYAYDIASAYPFALARLPCLQHGRWVLCRAWRGEPWACVRYRIEPHLSAPMAWGPLPHRLPDGNIVFPTVSAGGYAWGVELLEAQRLHPGVVASHAWVHESRCKCPPPFAHRVESLFERRRAWGKASRGIVLKLGLNSMYGKSAQRVGSGRFRCMVRAGLITATTRAMLLHAVSLAKDPWNILELATDSVLSREPLPLPPSPLGHLGAWEEKPWPGGVFLMRPGLRFATRSASDPTRTAARGLGVRVLHENRSKVLRAWARAPMHPVRLQQPSMFIGARSAVRRVMGDTSPDGDTTWRYVRDDKYGRWLEPTPRTLRYAPGPKRCEVLQDFQLLPWELPRGDEYVSLPYSDAPPSPLGELLDEMREHDEEQPDADMLTLL